MSKKLTALLGGALALCLIAMPILHAQISPGTSNLAAPGPIGGTTPNTGNFTSVTANSVSINGVPVVPGHGLIGVQTFCSSGCTSTGGTYTPDTGTNSVIVEVQAPGGGSPGCGATSTGQFCTTGGSGAGSYGEALITSGFSGVTVTAPAGGAGGAAGSTAGTAGATASFGTLISCPGGLTLGAAAVQPPPAVPFTAVGGGAGFPAACTLSGVQRIRIVTGMQGAPAFASGTAANQIQSGAGGPSVLGTPSPGQITAGAVTGTSGAGYGQGATGPVSIASQAAVAGGSGGPGLIIVYEFN